MDTPNEFLLVSSESVNPFTTCVVDPLTGSSKWSFKGSELQGAAVGKVTPLGETGDYLVISVKNKPLIHIMAVSTRIRTHLKSVIPGPASNIMTLPDGSALLATIKNQIFTWLIATGELLSIVDAHYEQISSSNIVSDGSMVAVGTQDGILKIFLISDLLSHSDVGFKKVQSIRQWRAHSLAVKSLCFTRNPNARIISCSLDYTAAIHSVSMNQCLLKVSADKPLTGCTIDPAESRLFVGSSKGDIVQINLYGIVKEERLEHTIDTHSEQKNTFFFVGHTDEIRELSLNNDGSILASGDSSGIYCIWDVLNRQCLRLTRTKDPINTLTFILVWPSIQDTESPRFSKTLSPLHRQRVSDDSIKKVPLITLPLQCCLNNVDEEKWTRLVDSHLQKLLIECKCGPVLNDFSKALNYAEPKESSAVTAVESEDQCISEGQGIETVRALKAQIAVLEKANEELYSFAAAQLLK